MRHYPMGSSSRQRAAPVRRLADDARDAYERVVPFTPRGRPQTGQVSANYSRDAHEATSPRGPNAGDRASSARPRRRARRAPGRAAWLQRNALSVAAVGVLVAFLGVGLALSQVLVRPEQAAAMKPVPGEAAATSVPPERNVTVVPAAPAPPGSQAAASPEPAAPREIQMTVRPLEPTYTVQQGDSLAAIAARFNTSIERLQALNELADPRRLSIDQKLVVPPPLQP